LSDPRGRREEELTHKVVARHSLRPISSSISDLNNLQGNSNKLFHSLSSLLKCMEEQRQQPQVPLSIDWNRQLQHDSPPREVVIVSSSTMASDQDDLNAIPDHKLKESIQSKKRTLEATGKNLPDNGAKLRATIDRYQQELSRRESTRLRQVPHPRFLSCCVWLRHLFSRVFPFFFV